MKKYLLFLCALCLLPATASAENIFNDTDSFTIAKTVKIGRERKASNTGISQLGSAGGKSQNAILCDANCASCNNTTGTCSMCKGNRFLNNNLCLVCPANATCKGTASFTCGNGYYKSGTACASCSSAMEGCTKCTSGTYCTTCSDGYELKNGKCEEKPKCSTAYVLSTGAIVDAATVSGGGPNGVTAEQKCAAMGKRLPTLAELRQMYQNQDKICNMTPTGDMGGWPYWSERIGSSDEAYRIIFAGGAFGSKGAEQKVSFKLNSGIGAYIRCVSGGNTSGTCGTGYTKNAGGKCVRTCTGTSASTCSTGCAWRSARSDGWSAGCYPIGNCNTVRSDLTGATCMFVDGTTGQGQCKTDNVWSGSSCSIVK